jgi:hypothetical protein
MRIFYSVLSIFLIGLSMGKSVAGENKTVYGYVEKVTLVEKKITLSAKLDTGAKSASLSAIQIQETEENGKTYLAFIVPTKSGNFQFKAEYAGRVRIKSRAGEVNKDVHTSSIKRPMVKVRIKLGNKERDILFNLTNRKRFNYPVLLGRDALNAFNGVVDPSGAFLQRKGIYFEVVETHDKA